MREFNEAVFKEVCQEMIGRLYYPEPDHIFGIFDGKLGCTTSLEGWEAWGVSVSGLPVFKRKL